MPSLGNKMTSASEELEAVYRSNIEKLEQEYRRLAETIKELYEKYATEYEKRPDLKGIFSIVLRELNKRASEELEAVYRSNIEKLEQEYRRLAETIKELYEKYATEYEKKKKELETIYESILRTERIKMVDSFMEKIFEDAFDRIASIKRDYKYFKLLKSLITEGLQYIDSQEVLLEVSKRDSEIIEKVIEETKKETGRIFKVKNKALESVGGVILSNPDQSVVIDNTFEARLKRFRPLLRSKLYRILFIGG